MMKSILVALVVLVHVNAGFGQAKADPETMFLSAGEARSFCLETWFPRLRVGHKPAPGEIAAYLDELMKLYTDDVELIDPNNQELFGVAVAKGKPQVRKYYEAVLTNYPLWKFTILDIFPTAAGFVLRYEGRDAPPVKLFEGVDILDLRRGDGEIKIAKLIGYYDRKPFSAPTPILDPQTRKEESP